MNIELPKDAEGREIPLDTKVMYGAVGGARNIVYWVFTTDSDLVDKEWRSCWRAYTDSGRKLDPELMHLTPPDSWEKLEEDLGRGKDICGYFEECPKEMDGKSCSECKKAALKNIASRIRKLRGED